MTALGVPKGASQVIKLCHAPSTSSGPSHNFSITALLRHAPATVMETSHWLPAPCRESYIFCSPTPLVACIPFNFRWASFNYHMIERIP